MPDPTDTFDIETADPGGGNDVDLIEPRITFANPLTATVGQVLGITPDPHRPALLVTPMDLNTSTLLEVPTDSRLAWYYENIDCTCITCVTPMPGSPLARLAHQFDVRIDCWGDDEGLLTSDPQLNRTIVTATGYPGPLVGNWIIMTSDDMGESHPLPLPLFRHLIKFLPLASGE